MLVLSRRESDQVVIPSLGITLQVLSVKGNVVKLGIDAPQSIKILRGELTEKSVDRPEDSRPAKPGRSQTARSQKAVPAPVQQPLRAYLQPGTGAHDAPSIYMDDSQESVNETRAPYEVCV